MSMPVTPDQALLPWHQPLWLRWKQQLERDRLPHALLLTGSGGLGKHLLAEAMVGAWLCSQPLNGQACGHCQSCHLLTGGAHPDFCYPETQGKSEQLRVNEIRELVAFCSKTAQLGERRLALIEPAGRMNRNAQNALLKTLEEPGDNTLLLLVAERPQLLLPTIKSRCQHHHVAPPSTAAGLAYLQQQGLDAATAEAALAASAGAPLLAGTIVDSAWFKERADWARQLLGLAQGIESLTLVAKQLGRYPQAELLEALCNWCHQSLRAGFLRQPVVDPALRAFVELLRRIGARAMSRWYDQLQQALSRQLRSANLNKELQLDQLLWQLTPSGIAAAGSMP